MAKKTSPPFVDRLPSTVKALHLGAWQRDILLRILDKVQTFEDFKEVREALRVQEQLAVEPNEPGGCEPGGPRIRRMIDKELQHACSAAYELMSDAFLVVASAILHDEYGVKMRSFSIDEHSRVISRHSARATVLKYLLYPEEK